MAEATGLVLGGIALASLVTTCVEFVEYFEDGRDCMRDFTLAVTKVKLMQVRLDQLGRAIQKGDIDTLSIKTCPPDGTAEAKHGWHHVAGALPEGLLGIRNIIERTTELCRRYCRGRGQEDDKSQVAAQPSTQQWGESPSVEVPPISRRARLKDFKRKTSWALHDKKKFDSLIADFDFILGSLEKIIETSSASISPKPSRESLPVMSEEYNTTRRMRDPKKGDRDPSPLKKHGAHNSQAQAVPDRTLSPEGETTFKGNNSNGQSLHFVGGQGHPGVTARFQENVSHDQSLAFTGNFTAGHEFAKIWGNVAMHALNLNYRQLGQPKTSSVRGDFVPKPMVGQIPRADHEGQVPVYAEPETRCEETMPGAPMTQANGSG